VCRVVVVTGFVGWGVVIACSLLALAEFRVRRVVVPQKAGLRGGRLAR
jgi:hypothetical protein